MRLVRPASRINYTIEVICLGRTYRLSRVLYLLAMPLLLCRVCVMLCFACYQWKAVVLVSVVVHHASRLERFEVTVDNISSFTFMILVEDIAMLEQRLFTLEAVQSSTERFSPSAMVLVPEGFLVPVLSTPLRSEAPPRSHSPNFKPCFVSFLSHHQPQALTHSRRPTARLPVDSITPANEFTPWRPSEHTIPVSSIASHRQIPGKTTYHWSMLTAFPHLNREGPDRHGRLEDTGWDALVIRPEYKHRTSPARAAMPGAPAWSCATC